MGNFKKIYWAQKGINKMSEIKEISHRTGTGK
jgi:hypothetical protein